MTAHIGKNKTYISSRMSDIKDNNFPAFRRKEYELKYKGLEVWNPANHEPDKTDVMWSEYLAQDIIDIEAECNSIYMFGEWYRSQGALIELLTAHRLGLTIIIEQWYLKWIPSVLNKLFKVRGSSKETLTGGVNAKV